MAYIGSIPYYLAVKNTAYFRPTKITESNKNAAFESLAH